MRDFKTFCIRYGYHQDSPKAKKEYEIYKMNHEVSSRSFSEKKN